MTEAEWAVSSDPMAMLQDLQRVAHEHRDAVEISDRKLRLFACACCLLRGTPPDIVDSYERNGAPTDDVDVRRTTDARWAAGWARGDKTKAPTRAQKAALLREIVGNPFRSFCWCGAKEHGRPNKCAMRDKFVTPAVLSIARAAYEERGRKCGECGGVGSFAADDYYPAHDCPHCRGTGRIDDGTLDPARLAVLSDALEEAGCTSEPLLMHLRGWDVCPKCMGQGRAIILDDPDYRACSCVCNKPHGLPTAGWRPLPGPHYRGCWALDLLLGKE